MRRTCGILSVFALTAVLGACPSPSVGPFPDTDGTPAPMYGDTVVDITARLITHLRMIDSAGRARGTLPDRLEEVVPARWLRDIFRNPFEYSTAGPTFTVRSPGRDGIRDTRDDIFVTGRLGRNAPCELHREGSVAFFEEQAPLCREVPIVVLPRCPDAEFLSVPEFDRRQRGPEARVRATGERLVHLARRIDGHGRAIGALPRASTMPWLKLEDAWGRRVDYRVAGHTFELASAGADGVPGNGDDIVVKAELGVAIPCAFTLGGEPRTCGVPPPECPQVPGMTT